jgi:hypothetical protein
MLVSDAFQVVFDKVAAHLLSQGEKSLRPGVGCAYKTDDGLKCAVGCLIEPQHYKVSIEGESIVSPKVQDVVIKSLKLRVSSEERILAENKLIDNLTLNNMGNVPLKISQLPEYIAFVKFLHDLQAVHDDYNPEEWEAELSFLATKYSSYVNND